MLLDRTSKINLADSAIFIHSSRSVLGGIRGVGRARARMNLIGSEHSLSFPPNL